jgi:hypothetical protein
MASTMGLTSLHGPHHGAQKSTRTGMGDPSTVSSNEASSTMSGPVAVSVTGVAAPVGM